MRISRRPVHAAFAIGLLGTLFGAGLSSAHAGQTKAALPPPAKTWKVAGGWGRPSGLSNVQSISSTGKSDAFAVGATCGHPCGTPDLAVRRWNGKSWVTIKPPSGLTGGSSEVLAIAAASSATSAWVFATVVGVSIHTDALRWNGKHWATTKLAPFSVMATAATFGPKNAWAFGTATISGKPYNLRYNGTKWQRTRPPGDPQALSALSATDMWAIGPTIKSATMPPSAQHLIAMNWTGSKWRTVRLPHVTKPSADYVTVGTVTALGPHSVWESYGLGNAGTCCTFGGLEHWDGAKWHAAKVPFPVGQVLSMAADGHGGIWLTVRTDGTPPYAFYHRDGSGHWTRQFPPSFVNVTIVPAALSWVPGTTSLWSGGTGDVAGKGIEAVILRS